MRNPELSKILCKRISDLITSNGLTAEQLAYQSGISKGGLSEIVRELKEPSNYTISKICIALNITMDEFFNFKELKDFIKQQY